MFEENVANSLACSHPAVLAGDIAKRLRSWNLQEPSRATVQRVCAFPCPSLRREWTSSVDSIGPVTIRESISGESTRATVAHKFQKQSFLSLEILRLFVDLDVHVSVHFVLGS